MRKRNFFKPAHRDAAEPLIITAGRSAGATVAQLSGKDVPDLLVGFKGVTFLGEVKSRLVHEGKDGYTRKTTTRISKGQKDFAETWRGAKVGLWYEPADMLRAIGAPFVAETEGPRWFAENGAFLCEHCWLPENGLHDAKCPTRKALARPPKVTSAYRAATSLAEAMPKPSRKTGMRVQDGVPDECDCVHVEPFPPPLRGGKVVADPDCMRCKGRATRRPSRGVEGELQPLKAKR